MSRCEEVARVVSRLLGIVEDPRSSQEAADRSRTVVRLPLALGFGVVGVVVAAPLVVGLVVELVVVDVAVGRRPPPLLQQPVAALAAALRPPPVVVVVEQSGNPRHRRSPEHPDSVVGYSKGDPSAKNPETGSS